MKKYTVIIFNADGREIHNHQGIKATNPGQALMAALRVGVCPANVRKELATTNVKLSD